MKIPEHFGYIPKVAEKIARKKKRPPNVAVVIEHRCTGCQVCIEFCPVDCIQAGEPRPGQPIPPVAIRLDECIGCDHCARACEQLTWGAIEMWPVEHVEKTFGVTIHDKFDDTPGWDVPRTYTGTEDGTTPASVAAPGAPAQWPAGPLPPKPVKPAKPPAKPKAAAPPSAEAPPPPA